MPLTENDRKNAQQLKRLISVFGEIKKAGAAKTAVPRISLRVDPPWCRQNPGESARRITSLTDALLRTIAHCDAATHKTTAYQNERDAILEALRSPSADN